jgi:hypothetical protein
LTLIYVEGTEATMAAMHKKGLSWMRAAIPFAQKRDLPGHLQEQLNRLSKWEESCNGALKRAYDLGHPVLISAAHRVMLGVFVIQLMNRRLEARYLGQPFDVPPPVKRKILGGITSALAVDEINGMVEGRLMTNILKADFLEITGDIAGAKEIAAWVGPEADAMSFPTIAERARELLEDRTLLMVTEREMTRFNETDEDVWFANMTDEELHAFACDSLESMDLPAARGKVVEQYCHSLRVVARERSQWCRHLQVLDDLRQTSDPATAFSVLPNRKCICEKLGHATEIVTPEAEMLIVTFKNLYCQNCNDRAPKSNA